MGSIVKQTPEQEKFLKDRMGAIRASEAAAVLGLHPWLSPIQVWISKTHPELVEPRDNFLLKLGTRLEPVIAACYEDETGRRLQEWPRVFHPLYPEVAASPDRMAYDKSEYENPGRLVELKSCNEFVKSEFGDFGTQDVPQAYLIQAWVQMEVTQIPICDIAALLGGANFGIYPIPEDKEVQQAIIEQLREWWDHYVVAKKEPPIDSSKAWSDYIVRRYPSHGAGMVKVNKEEHKPILHSVERYSAAVETIKEWTEERDAAANNIKAFIADRDGLLLPGGGKVTWKKDSDTVKDITDWEAVVEALCDTYPDISHKDLEAFKEANTKRGVITRQGSRKFIHREE